MVIPLNLSMGMLRHYDGFDLFCRVHVENVPQTIKSITLGLLWGILQTRTSLENNSRSLEGACHVRLSLLIVYLSGLKTDRAFLYSGRNILLLKPFRHYQSIHAADTMESKPKYTSTPPKEDPEIIKHLEPQDLVEVSKLSNG